MSHVLLQKGPILIFVFSVTGVSIYRLTLLFLYSPHDVSGTCTLTHPSCLGGLIHRPSTETVAPATVWSVIECGVAIICACLPNLAPGLRMIWTRCHHCCCWNRDTGTSSEDLVHGLRLQPVPPEQTKLEERVARSSGEDTVNGSLPI